MSKKMILRKKVSSRQSKFAHSKTSRATMYTLALTYDDRSVSYFMTTKRLRQGGIEPPAQLTSMYMAKLYFTTKPLARQSRLYRGICSFYGL